MSWFRSLRSYTPMRRRSAKVVQSAADWQAVYQLVDARSDGRCEYTSGPALYRCTRPARQHHHVLKPRRAHHDPDHVVGLCIPHHERCEWPYHRGRLVVVPEGGGAFRFRVLYAPDKFALRESTACSCLPDYHLHTPDGAPRCSICGCTSPPLPLTRKGAP